jgi:hypothetical protein
MCPKSPESDALRVELEKSLGPAEWSLIRKQMAKDTVILVSPSLELIEVALAVAKNEESRVQEWIVSGAVRKPDLDMLTSWEKTPERTFLCVVVQPFVLIQTLGN